MTKTEIPLTHQKLGEIVFKRLELKYEGKLEKLYKKLNDFENLVFSWQRNQMKELDELKSQLHSLQERKETKT